MSAIPSASATPTAAAAITAANVPNQKTSNAQEAQTQKNVGFTIIQDLAAQTPGKRTIHKAINLTNGNQTWEFQVRSTALGTHLPFTARIVEGISTTVDLNKIPMPKFIDPQVPALVKTFKTLGDCYNAFTSHRVLNKQPINQVPARNFVSLLPVKEATGKAPFHPTHDLVVKGEGNCCIVFDDAGTQFGYTKRVNESGKKYFGTTALPIQGNLQLLGINEPGRDWELDPISDADMQSKSGKTVNAIMKNALNILLYKLKKNTQFFTLGTASANVGIIKAGEQNEQHHKIKSDNEIWDFIPDSMVYIRVSGIAARTITSADNTPKTTEDILKLADEVIENGDAVLKSIA